MVSWEKVAEDLAEHIWAETGIPIDKEEFVFKDRGREVEIYLMESSFCQLEYLENYDEADIASDIINELGTPDELRGRLVEIRISQLERGLSQLARDVRRALKEKGVAKKVIDSLEFEIQDFGYFPAMHGMADAEVVTGYPDVELVITSQDGFEFTWPLDVYSLRELLDLDTDSLVQELLRKLKN